MKKNKVSTAVILSLVLMFVLVPACVFANSGTSKTALSYSGSKVSAPQVKCHATGNYSIKIKWNKIKNAKGYQIYRATKKSGKYTKIKTVKSSKTLSYTNRLLKKSKTYYYKVRGYKTLKDTGKFSLPSYAKATTALNCTATLYSSASKTNTVYLTVTNKSYKNIILMGYGIFIENINDDEELDHLDNMDDTESFTAYVGNKAKRTITIPPGEKIKVRFTRSDAANYSKYSGLGYGLVYKNTEYVGLSTVSYGTLIEKM